jgi:hypothetical protein
MRDLTEAQLGSRVWFAEEKRPYKVRARNDRFLICTKPFNARNTVIYSIVDLTEKVRGPDNLIFCFGYETEDQIAENMRLLAAGEIEVSHRRRIKLNVTRVDPASRQSGADHA